MVVSDFADDFIGEGRGMVMTKSLSGLKRVRKDFGRIPSVAPMPNLIEVQKSSYDTFFTG